NCSGYTTRYGYGVVVCISIIGGTTIDDDANTPAGHGHAVADGIAVAAAATVHEVVDGSCRYIDAVVGSGTNSAVTADDTLMHRTAGHDYGVVLGAANLAPTTKHVLADIATGDGNRVVGDGRAGHGSPAINRLLDVPTRYGNAVVAGIAGQGVSTVDPFHAAALDVDSIVFGDTVRAIGTIDALIHYRCT